jgi:hypothetical protein
MSQHERAPDEPFLGPLLSPWPVLGTGLALVGLGWMWGLFLDNSAPGLRVLVLAVGLVAIGSSLTLYVPHARRDLEGRLLSAGLWLLLAVAAYLAGRGLGSHFDSLLVLLQVLALAALSAAILSALPPRWRLLGGTVLLLLHFGTILTAVTVIPPPTGPSPYISNQLWSRLTRPYLQVTLLNNGYHFYAPEPGPAALLWFRVEFEDGRSAWVRIPDHKTCRNHLERRRWGALATVVGQTIQVPPERQDELLQRRLAAGRRHKIPMGELPPSQQYREPTPHARLLLASYARHVARFTEHPEGLDKRVVGVKVYRVEYFNPPVQHFQAGRDPLDPTLYMAFYMGEYDVEGKLKPASREFREGPDGRMIEHRDPFLYWHIPIVRVAEAPQVKPEVGPPRHEGDPRAWLSEGKVINYVRIHAGDTDEEGVP